MTTSSPVPTPQEGRSLPGPAPGSGDGPAVCLRSPTGGKLIVMRANSDRVNALTNWRADPGIVLCGACACGCGLPLPYREPPDNRRPNTWAPIQKYADPEMCRRRIWSLMHPTLDLSGMLPERAKQAARMAEEAVRAAKLGQPRATVDARSQVTHKAVDPDPRPSCRLRVTPRHFEMLAEMQVLGFHGGESFSAIVMDLIEREVEECRLRARQEGERDV